MVAHDSPFSHLPRWPRNLLAALWFFLTAASSGAAAEITASLTPDTVPAGEGANLSIRIINGQVSAIKAPEVAGLLMNGPNQSSQIRIEQGVRVSAMTLTYAIGSMTAGQHAIPPFVVTVDGLPVETQAFKLTVTPSANQTPAGLPPSGTAPGTPAAPTEGEENFGFLTLDFAGKDRQHAWVGEIAPVRIMAWLPDGVRVSLNTPLQPTGSSFTLHNVSNQPQQEQAILEGRRYSTVTWYGSLSFTKAGTYPPDLSMKIVVSVPDPNRRRQSTGDPFFDQMIGTPMMQKTVVLRNKTDPSANLEIRALPTTGKPEDFAGAVGKFSFGRTQIPLTWTTGEPQPISCEVEGEGNFTLLAQPRLHSDKTWKSYEGQSRFAAKDAASFTGTTTFQFTQVPRHAGPQQVHLAFSYFNPDTATYQTARSSPITVSISGTDLPDEPSPVVSAPSAVPSPPPPPTPAPQRTREGFTAALTPLFWRPTFRYSFLLLFTGLTAGFLTKQWRARLADPARLAKIASQQALGRAVQAAHQSAARGDVPGFFAAARLALQHQLAPLWQRPAPAITLADVASRVPADSPIWSIFQEADHQEFSPTPTLRAEDLPEWKMQLDQALTQLL